MALGNPLTGKNQELIQMVEKLYNWLSRNNVPTQDVKIYVEFPTESAKYKALRAFREELRLSVLDWQIHHLQQQDYCFDTLGTMYGIQVTLGNPTKTDLEEFLRALDNK